MKRLGWSRMAVVFAACILIAGFFAGCKSSTTPDSPTDQKVFTSSTELSHSHTITINKSDIQTPGTGGITMTTNSSSTYGGHTHTFAMTRDQLVSVMGGASVAIVTGVGDGGLGAHAHTFTILKWF